MKNIKEEGVMVKALNFGVVISEFEHQSRYYVHFGVYALGEDMNPLIYQLNSTNTVLEEWVLHWITYEGWYAIKKRTQSIKESFRISLMIYKFNYSLNIWFNTFNIVKILSMNEINVIFPGFSRLEKNSSMVKKRSA